MQQTTDHSVDQRKDVIGQYLDIALQWPLICPRKVLHIQFSPIAVSISIIYKVLTDI